MNLSGFQAAKMKIFEGYLRPEKDQESHKSPLIFLKFNKTIARIDYDAHTAKFAKTGSNIVTIAY